MNTAENTLILDACCGGREFWFTKHHPNALYIDNRTADKGHIKEQNGHSIQPDYVMDFTNLDFPDKSFKMVVFDPPQSITLSKKSILRKKWGGLNAETWQHDIKKGFEECWRVLDDYGTLIFKWSETEIKLKTILELLPELPLFGHTTGSKEKTKWLCFMKIP